METFKTIFKLEAAKQFQRKEMLILLAVTVLTLVLVHDGLLSYRSLLESKVSFQETERTRVNQFFLYSQYGGFGIRLMFIPSPFSVMYSDSGFNVPISHINTVDKLNIQKPLKGKNFFLGKAGYMDFAGVMLLFGAIAGLTLGLQMTKYKDYLKFLCSTSKPSVVFFSLFGVKVIFLSGAILLVVVINLLWLLLNGINLFYTQSLNLWLVAILANIFFICSGGLIGTFKRTIQLVTYGVVIVVFLFLIPWGVLKGVQISANSMESLFNFELKNLEIIMAFEKKAFSEIGIYKSGEVAPDKVKEAVKRALKEEYQQLRKREKDLNRQILQGIRLKQNISSFFPVTFYLSVSQAISSRGGESFTNFYTYSQELKIRFVEFYIRKKFYELSIPGKVKNFIAGDENLYFAESRLPANFEIGIGATLFYIFLLQWVTFSRFIDGLKGKAGDLKLPPCQVHSGKLNVLLTRDTVIRDHLYNDFAGVSLPPIITVNGVELRSKKFIYLPYPGNFPKMPDSWIYKILFNQSWKAAVPLWEILLLYAIKTRQAILFDDFFRDLKRGESEQIKRLIAAEKVTSICISQDEYLAYSIADQLVFSDEDETVEPVRLLKNH